jgi:hypothetical protein
VAAGLLPKVVLHGGPILLFAALLVPPISTDAFLFERVIYPRAKLEASDPAPGDRFGRSVALSEDTAIVGAWGDDEGSGSARVFIRSDESWTEQVKLVASDATPHDLFGYSIALSGNTVLIGAPGDGQYSGSAYAFTRSGNVWSQQAKLIAPDATGFAEFGVSVALSGNTAVVGAPGDDEAFGSAYVFVHSGDTWSRQAKLTAAPGGTAELFGWSVALSGDTALVGTSSNPEYATEGGTAAYVFIRAGGAWIQRAKLTPPTGGEGQEFGWAVALSGDSALVGAPANPLEASHGAAYLFRGSNATWIQEARLRASDESFEDGFAGSVALGDDTIVVGAPGDDDAYLFVRSGSGWTEQAKLAAYDPSFGEGSYEGLGRSVALWGDFALLGAPSDDEGGYEAGSAFLFDLRCREDGLDVLRDTPAEGAASGTVHEDVEPALALIDQGLGESADDLNCLWVEQLENVTDRALS